MRATHANFETTVDAEISGASVGYWALRIGAACCFIGHGAFGFITKAAWIPYFGVVGIPEAWAWKLMPIVGAVDVTAGMWVLFAPRGLPLVYMSVWAGWTALLRPLSGDSFFEAVERAGNYGVPFALLLLTAMPRSIRGLGTLLDGPTKRLDVFGRVAATLKWTTALLLAGHGALGAVTGKAVLSAHYATIGLPPTATALVGWFEIALATAVLVRPAVGLLLFVAAWKLRPNHSWWSPVRRSGNLSSAPGAMRRRSR